MMVSLHRMCLEDGHPAFNSGRLYVFCIINGFDVCGKSSLYFWYLIVGVTIYITHTISKLEEYLLG